MSKDFSYYLDMCIFFFKDFAGYLIFGFFGSICKLFGEGDKYINLRVKIKILFVNTHTGIYIF